MHTVLGGNGSVGSYVAGSLSNFTEDVRLVSRNPKKIIGKEELFKADLTRRDEVMNAVKGSEVVYLTVGLKYDTGMWLKAWPALMQNVIDACKTYNARLVFVDNVYMYGKVDGWMTEATPFNPCSKKGEIRAKVATMLLDEIGKKNITAMIARSADFYGPETENSFLNEMMIGNLVRRKNPQILIDKHVRHSYTYTPDAGYATALLGNTLTAFNQTWHLPTDARVLTGAEMLKIVLDEMGLRRKPTIIKPWMLSLSGLLNPVLWETREMAYQFKYEYLFHSGKFDRIFRLENTTYKEGLINTMLTYNPRRKSIWQD
ncbi:MAG: NAD-dependent epimerase/dehydratase family protein [Bacteroidales bacterium]|nr:NAD-dependent epimerase/dehydratase family protein [Bacteroidales bacterium]